MKILIVYLSIISPLIFVAHMYSCSCNTPDIEQQITKRCKSSKIKGTSIVSKIGLISEETARDIAQIFSVFPHEIEAMIVQYLLDEQVPVQKFDITNPQQTLSAWKVYDGNVRLLKFIDDTCCLMAELADETVMAWRLSDRELIFEKNRPWLFSRYHLTIELPKLVPQKAPAAEHGDYRAEVTDYVHPDDRRFSEVSGKTIDVTANAKAIISRIIARKQTTKPTQALKIPSGYGLS